ncbi:MAG: hypothetical protein IH865_07440 [Chloroflexi bacterium]|nr:hypothetical protein [Chloroflexota bacterium]
MVTGYSDDFVAYRKEAIEPLVTDNIQVRYHLLLPEFSRTSLNLNQQRPDSLASRDAEHAINANAAAVV